ncbi:hypothetical protein CSCA_0593 [Clostridium scatologenes]|uniref:Uncharacterized protein n=1 Tax=Clostridium scatologenes TaxID=1548 RepID=A0A0E3JX34_CLOSL|nr:hypothetical protein CSCA_0593 [Clostridium scatologenes]
MLSIFKNIYLSLSMMSLGGSFSAYLVVIVTIQLLWWLGIHRFNV